MLNRRAALLPAAAALVLVSCAQFGPARGPRIELFDLDSYLLARARVAETPFDAIAMALPPAVDLAPPPAVPAAPALAREAVEPSAIDILAPPVAVSRGAPIALPSPFPPAARAPTVPPTVQTASSASAASSAAAPAAPAPSPAKPAAAPAPAPATTRVTAASTSASAASGVAAPAAAKKIREVFARVGDEIEIGFDGVGFLFLGFADRQTDSMSFKARTVKEGKTFFTFKALKLGTWDLDFQQQDNTTGATRVENVRVVVLEEADFAAAVQRQTAQGGEPVLEEMEAGRLDWARKLESLGKDTAAIAEYLKGYREGNPELNDRIASLYTRTGDATAAEKYWRKNVGAASPWGDRAVVGIARLAVARGDVDGYLAWHRQLLAVPAAPIDDLLVDAALAARATGDVGLGIDLLAEYGRRYPTGNRMDEAAFVTAQLLEADSPFRDLKRSRDLYAALLREFPESPLAPQADERLRYLQEHFFTIR